MNPVARRLLLVVGFLALFGVADRATAQSEAKVRDLTDSEITVEELVDILSPDSEAVRARGLGVPAKPRCSMAYREQKTRGIGAKPTADVAAIKVHFAFNSAVLAPEATHDLDILGGALGTPQLADFCFRIEGHADSIGSDAYNVELSQERADAVVKYLVESRGLDPERFLAVGYGEQQPIASNVTEEGRSKNRRVQVANLGYEDAEP
jgi:outer membrane protein OmpA-like peptidoglycan-associated protein